MKKRTVLFGVVILIIIVVAFFFKNGTELFSANKSVEDLPTIAPYSTQWEQVLPGNWKIIETAFTSDFNYKWVVNLEANFSVDHHLTYRGSEKYFYCFGGDTTNSQNNEPISYIGGSGEGEWQPYDSMFYFSTSSCDFTRPSGGIPIYMLDNNLEHSARPYGTYKGKNLITKVKKFSKDRILMTGYNHYLGWTITCEFLKEP